MTDEQVKDGVVEAPAVEAAPSKEEMRDVPHEYVDANHNNDWCAVCGRSEGWVAHTKPAETVSIPAAPSTVATTAPLDKKPRKKAESAE